MPDVGYWTYLRSKLRFGWVWVPAVLTSLLALGRSSGVAVAVLTMIAGGALATLGATYASWRWSLSHPQDDEVPTRYVVAATLLLIAVLTAVLLVWEAAA